MIRTLTLTALLAATLAAPASAAVHWNGYGMQNGLAQNGFCQCINGVLQNGIAGIPNGVLQNGYVQGVNGVLKNGSVYGSNGVQQTGAAPATVTSITLADGTVLSAE